MNSIWHYTKEYALKYKFYFFGGLVLIILSRVFSNISSIYIKYIFDTLASENTNKLIQLVITFIVLEFISSTFYPLSHWVHDHYLILASKDLRLRIFKKLHDLDFYFHADKKSGSLISMVKRGDDAFWSFNLEVFRNLLRTFVDLIFVVGILIWIDPLIALIIGTSFIANLFATYILLKRNLIKRRKLNDVEDRIIGVIADNLVNYETVKIFANEKREYSRLLSMYRGWKDALWGYANNFRYVEVWNNFLTIISYALIFSYSIYSIEHNRMTIGDFALIITFNMRFFPNLKQVIFSLREVAKNYTDFQKYLNVLNEKETILEKPNATTLGKVTGKIDFENVSFQYKERENTIQKLDLHIKPNESVAIVGTSGAGKTTLVKLLMRFYDVSSGRILIDGHDLRDVTKESLRKNIGIVPQDPMLFNETIKFNLCYANGNASEEKMHAAAKLAYLDDFIESLPKKYETMVGERGIKLSGGQKQRLAIARMLIKDPEIVIFDEATSQLDSEAEKKIQDAFWHLVRGRTTIIIAHRLSTIMRVDRIIVLDKGGIAEEGKHLDLISRRDGIYRNLWNLQTGELKH